jgi:hypothetical protein
MTMKERADAQCPWTEEMENLGISEAEEITELIRICQEFFPTIETSGDCLFCNADHDGPLGEAIPPEMHERHCQLARLRQWLDSRGLLGLPHGPFSVIVKCKACGARLAQGVVDRAGNSIPIDLTAYIKHSKKHKGKLLEVETVVIEEPADTLQPPAKRK